MKLILLFMLGLGKNISVYCSMPSDHPILIEINNQIFNETACSILVS